MVIATPARTAPAAKVRKLLLFPLPPGFGAATLEVIVFLKLKEAKFRGYTAPIRAVVENPDLIIVVNGVKLPSKGWTSMKSRVRYKV